MRNAQSGTVVGQTKRKSIVPFICYIAISLLFLPPVAMKSYGRSLEVAVGLSMNSVLQFFREGNQRVFAVLQTAFFLNSWEHQYRKIEEQRREYEFRLAELERKAKETVLLRQVLGMGQNITWRHVNGEIIVRSGSTLQSTIAIDVGSLDGVRKDSPVIGFSKNNYGLIGKIQTVGERQSTMVSLVNHYYQLGVTAMLEKSRFKGILSSNGRFYRLDFISRQALSTIRSGDLVVSAGSKESLYPRGIPIGRIQHVEELEYKASISLVVQPIVELSQVEYVSVLIGAEILDNPNSDASSSSNSKLEGQNSEIESLLHQGNTTLQKKLELLKPLSTPASSPVHRPKPVANRRAAGNSGGNLVKPTSKPRPAAPNSRPVQNPPSANTLLGTGSQPAAN